MSRYSQKFKDPRWQKLRLKVLERDGFKCRRCGDEKSELHIHHGYYKNGNDPWDYEMESLTTLCVDCHEKIEEAVKYVRRNPISKLPEIFDGLKNLPTGDGCYKYPQSALLYLVWLMADKKPKTNDLVRELYRRIEWRKQKPVEYEI